MPAIPGDRVRCVVDDDGSFVRALEDALSIDVAVEAVAPDAVGATSTGEAGPTSAGDGGPTPSDADGATSAPPGAHAATNVGCHVVDATLVEASGEGMAALCRSGAPVIGCAGSEQGAVAEAAYELGVAEVVPLEPTADHASAIADRVERAFDPASPTATRHLRALPLGVAVLDASGTFTSVGEAYAAAFDEPAGALVGHHYADVYDPDAAPFEALLSGNRERWVGDLEPVGLVDLPREATRVDGERHSLHRTPGGVLCVRHGIPDLERPLSVAVEESNMLRSLLADIPVSIYFKNEDAEHVRVSEGMTDFHGFGYVVAPDGERVSEPEDVYGRTDAQLYPEAVSEVSLPDDRRVVEQGATVEDQVEQAPLPDGTEGWVTTTKVPWCDEDGDVVGIIGVTLDITERRRQDQEIRQQRDRLEEFTRIVAHDLRNPLSVAAGSLDVALEDGAHPDVERARDALERMEAIVSDLLVLAREGRRIDERTPVEVGPLARDVWASVETGDAALSLEGSIEVDADAERLRHVFSNLFLNAVEHGGEDVTVEVGVLDDEDGFYVADDGPGIPAEDRERVLESGYTTSEDGTGFGLPIVGQVVEAHGWTLAVAGRDGRADDEGEGAPQPRASGARFEVRT